MNKITKRVLIILLLCLFVFALIYYFWQNEDDGLTPTETPAPTMATPPATPTPAPQTPEPTPTPEPDPTPTPLTIRQEYLDLQAAYGNEDIVGHLFIENTSIDYLVLQAEDNEYYLDRDIYKNPYNPGWIFLDYENDITRQDPNTIIYGHNMAADIMFHSLRYYSSKDYYDNHKYIHFNTLYEDQVWEIFSFMKTTTDFNYIQVFFPTDDAAYQLAKTIQANSLYDTGVDINPSDRILSLSTCADGSPTSKTRLVVSARLLSREAAAEKLED